MPTPEDSGPHDTKPAADPSALLPTSSPREPVEDSADDPVPADVVGLESDDELKMAADAEATDGERAKDYALDLAERRYRNGRLGDPAVLKRLHRRYSRFFAEDVREDVVQNTVISALLRDDFPRPHEPLFLWIYRPGEAKRKQMARALRDASRRHVPLETLDAHMQVPSPDDDGLAAPLQYKQALIERHTAEDTGNRRALAHLDDHVNAGLPWEEVGARHGISGDTAKQRASRFSQTMKRYAKVGAPALLLLFVGVGYYVLGAQPPHVVLHKENFPPSPTVDPENPAPSSMPAVVTGEERLRASQKKDAGIIACDEWQWKECLALLDEATKLDPSLIGDPELEQGRSDAIHMLEAPRPGLKPTRPRKKHPAQ